MVSPGKRKESRQQQQMKTISAGCEANKESRPRLLIQKVMPKQEIQRAAHMNLISPKRGARYDEKPIHYDD
jgi:hypothetical protein